MNAITEYFKGVVFELKHIVWPSRNQTIILTTIVVVISIATGYYLGLFDFIFSKLLALIVA